MATFGGDWDPEYELWQAYLASIVEANRRRERMERLVDGVLIGSAFGALIAIAKFTSAALICAKVGCQ